MTPHIFELNAAHHNVCSSHPRFGIREQLFDPVKYFFLNYSDMPSRTEISITFKAFIRYCSHLFDRIHDPSMGSFLPDRFDPAIHYVSY